MEELAAEVQAWSEKHGILPANGQAAEAVTERTIRYYRTLGLLDAPLGNYTKTFSEKHRLQLIAIRIYQSQGLPLRRIRDELYGQRVEDLVELEKQARRGRRASAVVAAFVPSTAGEAWLVSPLAGDFLLVSRRQRELPRAVLVKINELILSATVEATETDKSKGE